MTRDIIDQIDNAMADYTIGADAMRHRPEPEHVGPTGSHANFAPAAVDRAPAIHLGDMDFPDLSVQRVAEFGRAVSRSFAALRPVMEHVARRFVEFNRAASASLEMLIEGYHLTLGAREAHRLFQVTRKGCLVCRKRNPAPFPGLTRRQRAGRSPVRRHARRSRR